MNMAAPKPTKAEKEQRVAEIYELLLKHVTRAQIVRYCAKRWGVGDRTADNYMAAAREMLYEETLEDAERSRRRILRELDYLYSESLRKNRVDTCLNIKREQARLLGLDITKIDLTGTMKNENHNYDHLTDEEVEREIQRLLAIRSGGTGE